MPFTSELPIWLKAGVKPTATAINTEGWGPGKKPPADWFDWLFNKNYLVLKELQEKSYIKPSTGIPKTDLDSAVQTTLGKADTALQTVPAASSTVPGITKVINSVVSTSITEAATPSSVKTAYDLANSKFSKPASGIPKTDLDSAVQTTLGKADTALQTVPAASSTVPGISRVIDSTSSTSTTDSATPNSVKLVNDSLNTHKNDYKAHLLYNATTGVANVYVLTPALAIATYAAIEGVPVGIKINVDNTGPSTINISAKGAVAILNSRGNPLPAGTLKAGIVYTLKYNGTSFFLQGEGGGLSDAENRSVTTAINNLLNG